MLGLRKWLGAAERKPPADPAARRRLATAVLLLETARADFEHDPAELAVVRRELARSFGIAEDQLDGLIGEALHRAERAVSLHDFVAALNAELAPHDKEELLAMLWRIAYADGRLDPGEEHLIRRLAELLHLPHASFIRHKLREAPA